MTQATLLETRSIHIQADQVDTSINLFGIDYDPETGSWSHSDGTQVTKPSSNPWRRLVDCVVYDIRSGKEEQIKYMGISPLALAHLAIWGSDIDVENLKPNSHAINLGVRSFGLVSVPTLVIGAFETHGIYAATLDSKRRIFNAGTAYDKKVENYNAHPLTISH